MTTKDILYELRTKNGLSQDELAGKVFVTRQAVSRWETGETVPNTETLKRLSDLFCVSINTLLGSPRKLVCQCCGMPLEDALISRNKDGSLNEDYCKWCYADGVFTYSDLDELIEVCVRNMANEQFPEDQARVYLRRSQGRKRFQGDAQRSVRIRGAFLPDPGGSPLLIPHHMEHRAAAYAQVCGGYKECRTLHLAGQDPQPLPGHPVLFQLLRHGHDLRPVLAIKGILALHHADLMPETQADGGFLQGAGDIVVRSGGIGQRGIFPAGPLGPHGG